MERHVTSRIISERLKALGVKQKSEFYWCPIPKIGENGKSYFDSWDIQHKDHMRYFGKKIRVSAFLTSELTDYIYNHTKKDFWIYHNAGKYQVQSGQHDVQFEAETLADAFGLMLEYLIQNKMI